MNLTDYHIHTVFSDGENTPEETVLAAIEKGLTEIGFSDHSYMPPKYGVDYSMREGGEEKYKAQIARLKEKYKGKIKILCGIEQDYYSHHPAEGFDYIIGSVHFILNDGGFFPVDESARDTIDALKFFGNDIYTFTEEYYKLVADVVNKTNCDIIGHFDLVSKFNGQTPLFDEQNERYRRAWQSAADALLKTGKPFEINTGAMAAGLKKNAYPNDEIIEYIKSRGGKFILAGDSHKKENLCFAFQKYKSFINADITLDLKG